MVSAVIFVMAAATSCTTTFSPDLTHKRLSLDVATLLAREALTKYRADGSRINLSIRDRNFENLKLLGVIGDVFSAISDDNRFPEAYAGTS